jgi:hypothetical protein
MLTLIAAINALSVAALRIQFDHALMIEEHVTLM